MILPVLILILIAGGILSALAGRWSRYASRLVTLIALLTDLGLAFTALSGREVTGTWMIEYTSTWMPKFGVGIHLGLDGLSLIMLILTLFTGIIAVLASWKETRKNEGFYNLNILWALAGISGVFLSADLFLFYFFWELMLIPTYFIILLWGGDNREFASFKFFIYTQAGGLLMLIAIIGLYLVHGRATGIYTFDYQELINTNIPGSLQMLLMLGFLAAFFVKIPAFPFHTWLADAYTEAPLAGSLILSALMAKTGVYGIIRFAVPLFPDASKDFAPVGMILGAAGILYGASLALSQTDLKRLIAYSSLSHMGFAVLGIYAFNEIAYQGVIMQMLVHAVSTGALFIIAAQLYERTRTRDIVLYGGLWNSVPSMGALAMIFAMASLGLPGLGNFIAEVLILAGTFKASIIMSSIASLGLIAATLYALRMVRRIFFDSNPDHGKMKDLSVRESFILGVMVIAILFTGLFPQPIVNIVKPAIVKSISIKKNADADPEVYSSIINSKKLKESEK
jgi:NADH-quinone oxidoreductase subunit M